MCNFVLLVRCFQISVLYLYVCCDVQLKVRLYDYEYRWHSKGVWAMIWRLGYYLSFWAASLARTIVRRESNGFMIAWKSLIHLDNKVPVSNWLLLSDFGSYWFAVTFVYVLFWEGGGLNSVEKAFTVIFLLDWWLVEVGWVVLEFGLRRFWRSLWIWHPL